MNGEDRTRLAFQQPLNIGDQFEAWAASARAGREDERRWRRARSESPAALEGGVVERLKQRHPLWETSLSYSYSVDCVPDLRVDATGRRRRVLEVLTIEFSVVTPGWMISQGMLNDGHGRTALYTMCLAPCVAVFGRHRPLMTVFRAHPPVPVVDLSNPERRNVHLRSPISATFLADADWPLDAALLEGEREPLRGDT